jgi:tRNA(Arg) A34 adenosine deaminase TadA
VPIRLLDNAKQLSYLLEDYEVQAIRHMPSVPPPKVDSHTSLYGIINRMLKKEAEERPELEKGLLYLDQTHGIIRKFMVQYKNCEPQIHAEVLALKHFYRSRKSFPANDCYIGCSKAACVCCEMYFKYHPAQMVVPKSHRKVWQNWGPPFVENYAQKRPHRQTASRYIKQDDGGPPLRNNGAGHRTLVTGLLAREFQNRNYSKSSIQFYLFFRR